MRVLFLTINCYQDYIASLHKHLKLAHVLLLHRYSKHSKTDISDKLDLSVGICRKQTNRLTLYILPVARNFVKFLLILLKHK